MRVIRIFNYTYEWWWPWSRLTVKRAMLICFLNANEKGEKWYHKDWKTRYYCVVTKYQVEYTLSNYKHIRTVFYDHMRIADRPTIWTGPNEKMTWLLCHVGSEHSARLAICDTEAQWIVAMPSLELQQNKLQVRMAKAKERRKLSGWGSNN